MRKLVLACSFICGFVWGLIVPLSADAQSNPGFYNGQVPTAGQWNSAFSAKQDYNPDFLGLPYTWTASQTWTAQGTFQAHVALQGSAPVVSSCGTSPSITGSDAAGEVTTGTASPTACTITFAVAYTVQPICIVQDRTVAANLTSYALTLTTIVIANTAASSQKIAYVCFGT